MHAFSLGFYFFLVTYSHSQQTLYLHIILSWPSQAYRELNEFYLFELDSISALSISSSYIYLLKTFAQIIVFKSIYSFLF